MALPQTAICAETGSFGLFLTLQVDPGGEPAVRRAAADLSSITAALAVELAEPGLVSALAFGAVAWPRIVGKPAPRDFAPFQEICDGQRKALSTPADLFLHIHSPRHDANFSLARKMTGALGPKVRVIEEIFGFKTFGQRDLTGFVDGTENPKGEDRAAVALVGDHDPEFDGGSYVTIQRWVHNLAAWEAMPLAAQERIIGRTKANDQELDESIKPATAHIARVVIDDDGGELEILRQSLPYGTTSECGLYFVAYAADPQRFIRMMTAMVRHDGEGNYDRLMDFTTPATGASFFAPSIDYLRELGDE